MSLIITERPREWVNVVGQERALAVLQPILSKSRFIPRGILFAGPHGVGKTTCGYLTARAMMCIGGNPLGCGKCASCVVFDEHPDQHPDFTEVDAASNSGVEAARTLVEIAKSLPIIGRKKVVLLDECHRLSRDAWDVYLKPLEQLNNKCVFLFATTDATRVPRTIRSRTCKIPFSRVAADTLIGYLCNIAAKHKIEYELDGIKLLVRASHGHVRDALHALDGVASLGPATADMCGSYIDAVQIESPQKVLLLIAQGRIADAITVLDEIARTVNAARAVELLFGAYGRAVYGDPTSTDTDRKVEEAIRVRLGDHQQIISVFLRWLGAQILPADALPMLVLELDQHRAKNGTPKADPGPIKETLRTPVERTQSGTLAVKRVAELLGAEVKKL